MLSKFNNVEYIWDMMIFLYNNLMDLYCNFWCIVFYLYKMDGRLVLFLSFCECNMFLVVEFWEMIIIVCFVNLL